MQLLLTFDPVLVEKVSILLTHIMQDNPTISKLYQTGFFYFILMYTGSNLLPIGTLLQMTHSCQAFKFEEVFTIYGLQFFLQFIKFFKMNTILVFGIYWHTNQHVSDLILAQKMVKYSKLFPTPKE